MADAWSNNCYSCFLKHIFSLFYLLLCLWIFWQSHWLWKEKEKYCLHLNSTEQYREWCLTPEGVSCFYTRQSHCFVSYSPFSRLQLSSKREPVLKICPDGGRDTEGSGWLPLFNESKRRMVMRRRTNIRQHDRTDCAAACIASIAGWYGYSIPLTVIREASGTGA